MKTALVFITDGRLPYFEQCWATIDNLHHDWWRTIVIDDSASRDTRAWVKANINPDVYVAHADRQGGAQSVRTAWSTVAEIGADYIFHVEEDFTFPRPVEVQPMIDVLEDNPTVAQMVLRRQQWAGEPPGGYLSAGGDLFKDKKGWLSHRQGFWLNPCLYPIAIPTGYEWPRHGDEGQFSRMLWDDGWFCGVWGDVEDPPRCLHIGYERSPAWTW